MDIALYPCFRCSRWAKMILHRELSIFFRISRTRHSGELDDR